MPHTSYDILGPFSIGKMEYDGDPLESPVHGGVEKARIGAKRFPSEFAEGGFVSWQAHKTGAHNGYAVDVSFPHILWNKHVQLTNSMPILEWQSWAVADFLVTKECAVRISCAGVHSFSVDRVGSPWYAGDIYRSGLLSASLLLAEGVHSIYAKVKAKVSSALHCQVRQVKGAIDTAHTAGAASDVGELVELTAPRWLPDVVAGDFAGDGVASLLLLNLHPSSMLTNISLSIPPPPPPRAQKAAAGGKAPPQRPYVFLDPDKQTRVLGKERETMMHVPPGQLRGIHLALSVQGGHSFEQGSDDNLPAVCPAPFRIRVRAVLAGSGRVLELESEKLSVRCRKRTNQSFLLSFLDHDGTVNRAAVVPPLSSCRRAPPPASPGGGGASAHPGGGGGCHALGVVSGGPDDAWDWGHGE